MPGRTGFRVGICDVERAFECRWPFVGDSDFVGEGEGLGKSEAVFVLVRIKGSAIFSFWRGDRRTAEAPGLMGIFEGGVAFGLALNFSDVCFVICSGCRSVSGWPSEAAAMRLLRSDSELRLFFLVIFV